LAGLGEKVEWILDWSVGGVTGAGRAFGLFVMIREGRFGLKVLLMRWHLSDRRILLRETDGVE
jgi:hypothetical protein